MIRSQTSVLLLITILGIILFACVAVGQEPILSFTVLPTKVEIAPGETAPLVLSIDNKSLHPGDDIAVSLTGADGFSLDPAPADIKVIKPFGKAALNINLVASPDVAIGTHDLKLQVIYTYCIDVSCFQIVDEVNVPVLVTTILLGPATMKKARRIPPWVIPMINIRGSISINAKGRYHFF